ncbi:TPA: hypothetical protein GDD11_06810 [Legionella pneumophila]|nr:hypothetical protein [Legionella pneumophila]HAT8331605.1 hypothetical protein [Legionella pneumophila]HAT8738826.1 hypothetical protein [Legionella pneumophila]HAT9116401.1 hypothetical protein [Legionella pneumophila subsp. pneumophila]HAU1477723.1 hypothetical protein [Legionella pneumophila]
MFSILLVILIEHAIRFLVMASLFFIKEVITVSDKPDSPYILSLQEDVNLFPSILQSNLAMTLVWSCYGQFIE